jgi:Lrp/AsnC family leucine-responsive transcriptional regulator
MVSSLDRFDKEILEILKVNGRESYAEIGRRIGLSASSVRERMQRLFDIGVIKNFTIEMDQNQLGYKLEAFIIIKLFTNKLKAFISSVNKFEGVIKSYRITGSHNVLMKVALRDNQHLQNFLDKIMIFGDTTTFTVLSEIIDKENKTDN